MKNKFLLFISYILFFTKSSFATSNNEENIFKIRNMLNKNLSLQQVNYLIEIANKNNLAHEDYNYLIQNNLLEDYLKFINILTLSKSADGSLCGETRGNDK